MADFVFNVAKGRTRTLYDNVQANTVPNSALVLVAINANAVTDATLKDLDTLSAVLGTAANEVTNTGYARKVLTDTSLVASSVDDTNDRVALDFADQTWTAVAAGDAWTDIIVCYDPDTTAGTDADLIPISCHDFAVTPDGSDIQATVSDFLHSS